MGQNNGQYLSIQVSASHKRHSMPPVEVIIKTSFTSLLYLEAWEVGGGMFPVASFPWVQSVRCACCMLHPHSL
jgi:hypothetical protein